MPTRKKKTDEFPRFERAMMISAHPDDPDFSAAGTLARLAEAGTEVTVVICTDGREGGEDPSVPDAELTKRRYPDGRLEHTVEFRKEIAAQIRRHRPELVLTHVPSINLDMPIGGYHPDHLAVGQATLAAVYPAARNPRAFRELLAEGLEAWRVKEVWIPLWMMGDFYVDISSSIEKKIKALRQHESQFTNWKDWEEGMRDRMRKMAKASGTGYEYVEGFKRIKIG